MKNIKLFSYGFVVIVLVTLCGIAVKSGANTVVDFSRSARGNTSATISSATVIACDPNVSWTCKFTSKVDDSWRSVSGAATAHINADGTIYLQEDNTDNSSASDNWSVILPAWYVSSGLTSYSLIGTDCKITITPTISAGAVTDWVLSVQGSSTTTAGKGVTTNTCGGSTPQTGKSGKSGKEKTGTSAKGPGPK